MAFFEITIKAMYDFIAAPYDIQELNQVSKGPGVYAIRNQVNQKIYIGSTKTLRKRFWDHVSALTKGTHYNAYLQRAWDKHGSEAFVIQILEESHTDDPLFLRELEESWACRLGAYEEATGYNLLAVMEGPVGRASAETRAKMSASRKGKKFPPEWRANMGLARRGIKLSEEHKHKLSEVKREKNRARRFPPDEHQRFLTNLKVAASQLEHRRGKVYQVTSPDGETFVIRNLGSFCRSAGIKREHVANSMKCKTFFYGFWFLRLKEEQEDE